MQHTQAFCVVRVGLILLVTTTRLRTRERAAAGRNAAGHRSQLCTIAPSYDRGKLFLGLSYVVLAHFLHHKPPNRSTNVCHGSWCVPEHKHDPSTNSQT